jgi:hypothetical protein
MYYKLKNGYLYKEENIYLMYSHWRDTNHEGDSRVDGRCTWKNPNLNVFGIKDAIEDIGNKVTLNDFIYFTEISHGPDDDEPTSEQWFSVHGATDPVNNVSSSD